jgi:MarR family transcriptional regulator, organic hydroperoxide resistance regulator
VPTKNERNLATLLSRAEQCITGRLDALLSAEGSTLDEWRVLSLLARAGGQSMSAIADATMLAPPTLTKRIDRMVADGLVHRRVDDADRRRVLVLLVPRGHAHYERLAGAVHEEEARIAGLATARGGMDVDQLTAMLAELLLALDETAPFLDEARR